MRSGLADFEYLRTLAPITGDRTPGYRITCCECGEAEITKMTGGFLHARQDTIEAVFRQRGWDIGRTRHVDLCPFCVAAAAERKRAKKAARRGVEVIKETVGIAPQVIEGEIMSQSETKPAPAPVLSAPAPRQMTLADRRRINAKLAEVYMVDCYMGGWSDEKLARDMDVPRAWIVEIRELMYGPAINEDVLEARAVIRDALTKVATIERAIEGLIDELGKVKVAVQAAAKKVGA